LRQCHFVGAAFLCLLAGPGLVRADTVHLKDGRVIEGDVVRQDATQVVIVVQGTPQAYPLSDVMVVARSRSRLHAPTALSMTKPAARPQIRTGVPLVRAIRDRLLAFHTVLDRLQRGTLAVRYEMKRVALEEFRRAAAWRLPLYRGAFSPQSALADLLILLGVRATALWLSLLLLRQGRPFTRITEFLVVVYGITALCMMVAFFTQTLWVAAAAFPAALGAAALLFVWMFGVPLGRASMAMLITLVINLTLEAVLLKTVLP
jgi:hypothetical protein